MNDEKYIKFVQSIVGVEPLTEVHIDTIHSFKSMLNVMVNMFGVDATCAITNGYTSGEYLEWDYEATYDDLIADDAPAGNIITFPGKQPDAHGNMIVPGQEQEFYDMMTYLTGEPYPPDRHGDYDGGAEIPFDDPLDELPRRETDEDYSEL